MNAKDKKQWVGALRSGKYVQCFNQYVSATGACCAVGVLMKEWNTDEMLRPITKRIGYAAFAEVVNLNDDRKTFKEIATYIEENL